MSNASKNRNVWRKNYLNKITASGAIESWSAHGEAGERRYTLVLRPDFIKTYNLRELDAFIHGAQAQWRAQNSGEVAS